MLGFGFISEISWLILNDANDAEFNLSREDLKL